MFSACSCDDTSLDDSEFTTINYIRFGGFFPLKVKRKETDNNFRKTIENNRRKPAEKSYEQFHHNHCERTTKWNGMSGPENLLTSWEGTQGTVLKSLFSKRTTSSENGGSHRRGTSLHGTTSSKWLSLNLITLQEGFEGYHQEIFFGSPFV